MRGRAQGRARRPARCRSCRRAERKAPWPTGRRRAPAERGHAGATRPARRRARPAGPTGRATGDDVRAASGDCRRTGRRAGPRRRRQRRRRRAQGSRAAPIVRPPDCSRAAAGRRSGAPRRRPSSRRRKGRASRREAGQARSEAVRAGSRHRPLPTPAHGVPASRSVARVRLAPRAVPPQPKAAIAPDSAKGHCLRQPHHRPGLGPAEARRRSRRGGPIVSVPRLGAGDSPPPVFRPSRAVSPWRGRGCLPRQGARRGLGGSRRCGR